jgi:type IV pilus assembly protein PilB
MAKGRGDFTDVLVKKGLLAEDQIAEAKVLQQQTGAKLQDALVKLGYVSQEDIMAAIAEHSGLKSVTLTDMQIPPSIIEMVP